LRSKGWRWYVRISLSFFAVDRLEALMHAGARRRFPDPPRSDDAARLHTVARAASPPVAHTGSAPSEPAVSPGAPARGAGAVTRGDELGAILARAVAKRAHDGFETARHGGATLQRFLGIGKKKKPPRPTQALPAPARPTQALPAPARPKQALPPSAAASPSVFIPGAVPQALIDLGARKFDLGSEMDPFEARQFNLDTDAGAVAPPPPAAQPAAAVAPAYGSRDLDDGYAPELVPDASGLVPVEGDPYLEWLVSSFASDRGTIKGPRSYGALRNLQVIASLKGYPKPRPIDRKYLAASSTAYDWGFEY
jgi:hypothetical protein